MITPVESYLMTFVPLLLAILVWFRMRATGGRLAVPAALGTMLISHVILRLLFS
jgi:hypothetical protein